MKLASVREGRDGGLLVISRDLERARSAIAAPTLQAALDCWSTAAPGLAEEFMALEGGDESTPFEPSQCASPLPRAYQWADGSAYVTHVELVRKARGAVLPDSFWTEPLMYQGGSDSFLGPCDDIIMADEAWGIDFEAEVAIITDDVPAGVSPADAIGHIKLLMLVNDVSLRNLTPGELGKGFGFFRANRRAHSLRWR